MTPTRRKRLYYVLLIAVGLGIATTLILYAMRQNINLYHTPRQVASGQVPKHNTFRIGGMVVKGSLQQQGMQVRFVLTDGQNNVPVRYTGILPDLFREGQGIVAQGKLNENNEFIANEVLAKHDEKYMPPIVSSPSE